MTRKILTTAFLAGFLALGLGGCDWCCPDESAADGVALEAGSGDCGECLAGCEDMGVAGDAVAVDAEAALGCELAADGLDMCGDAAAECAESACDDVEVPECDGGGCAEPSDAPKVPLD